MAFLLAAAIIALYFWTSYSDTINIDKSFIISVPILIAASITAIICLTTYLVVPKKYLMLTDVVIYLLIMGITITLILSTGNAASPFVAIWMLVVLFAAVFGLWGLLPVLIAAGIFAAAQFVNGNFKTEVIIVTIFSTIVPLIASALIWRPKTEKDEINNDNKAFRNLANELSEVANKSEAVINAIGDGVVMIDGQGIIQLINPAAQIIIGWGKQDAMTLNYKSVLKLVDQKDAALDPASDPIQQALNINQQIRTNNLTLMTKSDKKIMISLVVSPVNELGSGVIAVFHDVTKEKAEEREQAEFISTASHEMRTPVASIEGYLGLALNPQTASIDNRARDFILKAHGSAQHLGSLFQDLLDVSKADDGRIANNPKVVDIVKFVKEITEGLEQKAIEKGLRLTFKPEPENTREKHIAPVYSVNLDNDHIREIVDNLIENAIKYTPTGEVIVDINGDDDHVVISIKDSGIGIPAEDMPHLFQKFYRVDDKNTREIGGTGLGLYLCRRLSEIMGGRIWAESIYTSGSTFYVELPRISSKDAAMLVEQEAFKAQQEANQVAQMIASQKTQETFLQNQAVIQQAVSRPSFQVVPQPQPVQNVVRPQGVTLAPQQFAPQMRQVTPAAPTTRIINQPMQTKPTVQPANNVPRGQALTPEQIAAYVAKQRALAMQQATQQLGRPQSVAVPARGPRP